MLIIYTSFPKSYPILNETLNSKILLPGAPRRQHVLGTVTCLWDMRKALNCID